MRIFCSICKEIFIPYAVIKVTNCGHVYHGSCIGQWCAQHKTCPQCRSNLKIQPFRVYLDVETSEVDVSTLEHQLETVNDKLREYETANKKLKEEIEKCEKISKELKESADALKEKNDMLTNTVKTLKNEVSKLTKKNELLEKLQKEVSMWKNKVNSFERIQYLLKASTDEINKLVEKTPVTSQSVKQLCTYVGVLKLQLKKGEAKYEELSKEHKNLTITLNEEKYKKVCELEDTIKFLRLSCSALEEELISVKQKLREEQNKNALKEDDDVIVLQQNTVQKQFNTNTSDKPQEKPQRDSYVQEVCENIRKWEEMVCAGQSKNFGIGHKHRSVIVSTNSQEANRSSANYAYDGLGSRKKIRLGSPTPREEFLHIRKANKRRAEATPQPNKIIDYFQID